MEIMDARRFAGGFVVRNSAARALFRLSYTSDSASVSGLTRAIQ